MWQNYSNNFGKTGPRLQKEKLEEKQKNSSIRKPAAAAAVIVVVVVVVVACLLSHVIACHNVNDNTTVHSGACGKTKTLLDLNILCV